MAQHFRLSAAARTISLGQVLRMVDAEAETTFAPAIWWRLLHKSEYPPARSYSADQLRKRAGEGWGRCRSRAGCARRPFPAPGRPNAVFPHEPRLRAMRTPRARSSAWTRGAP